MDCRRNFMVILTCHPPCPSWAVPVLACRMTWTAWAAGRWGPRPACARPAACRASWTRLPRLTLHPRTLCRPGLLVCRLCKQKLGYYGTWEFKIYWKVWKKLNSGSQDGSMAHFWERWMGKRIAQPRHWGACGLKLYVLKKNNGPRFCFIIGLYH